MQAIQQLLTIAIEATTIIGFGAVVLKEIAAWTRENALPTPSLNPHYQRSQLAQQAIDELQLEQPQEDELREFSERVEEAVEEMSQPQEDELREFSERVEEAVEEMSVQPQEATKPQQPTFNAYSPARLRKIAKEMKIKRYSVMSQQELMVAITKHPKAQQLLTA